MVKLTTIQESNAHFAAQQQTGRVCVFAGATRGIGFATLKTLVTMLASSTFYILGRSESRFASQLVQLKGLSTSNNFVFVETELSLIESVDDACSRIMSAGKVDYLCMSSGAVPFHGAVYTREGLETCFALSYYTRLRLVSILLPLLYKSTQPRVLSILNATQEKRINEDDIGLQESWSLPDMVKHATLLTSLTFDYLAAKDEQKKITFIHTNPGFVSTDIAHGSTPPQNEGFIRWLLVSAQQLVFKLILRVFGMGLEEAGQRHAFNLTSEALSPGSYRVDRHSEVVPDNSVLVDYQERGWPEKIWDHTMGTYLRIVTS